MRIFLNCRLLWFFAGFELFPVLCPSLLGGGGLDAALTTGRCRYRRRGSITSGEGGEPFLEPPLSRIRANWLWRLIQKLVCVRVDLQLWLGAYLPVRRGGWRPVWRRSCVSYARLRRPWRLSKLLAAASACLVGILVS